MYRGPSPIFDIPEFPTLRRVKPLPKRRRTSSMAMTESDVSAVSNVIPMASSLDGLQRPAPDATTEELLAHADTLSTRMALQSYYMPMLSNGPDFLIGDTGGDGSLDAGKTEGNDRATMKLNGNLNNDLDSNASSLDFGTGYVIGREDEDEQGDGDYIDHLQQPGNTKKRKVPANASATSRGHDPSSSAGQDESLDRGVSTGRPDHEAADSSHTPSTFGLLAQRKGKLTAATLAGLQHKEMLKSRKRQLAAVLGALSHGDTLALDQALSANYPFATSGFDDMKNSEPPNVRLSRRRVTRLARAARRHSRHPDQIPFPASSFTFACSSATADRLIATKEEVAMLRNRFEAELARQAAKAAKLAAASRVMASLPQKGSRPKRADRAQHHARTITSGTGEDQTAEFLDQTLIGVKSRGGKKKKRSALANASNPHHLRNYVPSRLPHSSQTNTTQTHVNVQNIGPLPLRFLSAEIPPRRRKKASAVQPMSQLTNPADEWICAFCEHALFYGDEQEHRRAIRNRKKILRRRRRARERAAAAASGKSTLKVLEKSGSTYEDHDAAFEQSADEFATTPKHTKWRGDPNKERERGEQDTYG